MHGRTDGWTYRQTDIQTDENKLQALLVHVLVMQAMIGVLFTVQAGDTSAFAAVRRREGGLMDVQSFLRQMALRKYQG